MPPKKKAVAATKPTAAAAATKPAANAAFPFVSVLTPTCNRRKFIPLAIQMFKAQTYPQERMEWVILDDGTDKVGDLFAASGLTNVRYHALDTKLPIGAKRNRVNELAKGDICVAWDDDDYYPPDRVKNAVGKLRSVPNRRVPVTGSSQMYLYYTDRDEIWNIGPYNPNHCTNGTMAYWRSYFKEHRYDDTAEKAEERVFMDNWKTPVLQLKPEDTMLVICHSKNTFDKRILLEKTNPTMRKLAIKMRRFVSDKKIAEFYLSLKDDFKVEDVSGTPVTFSAEDLNPALQFTDVSATAAAPAPAPAEEETEATPTLVLEELPSSLELSSIGHDNTSPL
jgi:glycosyltransferase involved in cell wall biosynthesis